MPTGATTPAASRPHTQQDDWAGLIFLVLLIAFMVWVMWRLTKMRRWTDESIAAAVLRLKEELPPLMLVGEFMSGDEAADFHRRVERLEARTGHLERRLSSQLPREPNP